MSYPVFPQPPRKPSALQTFLSLPRVLQIVLGLVAAFLVIFVGSAAIAGITSSGKVAHTPTAVAARATNTTATRPTATSTPIPQPTATATPLVIHYPPTTLADLRGLAAKGDASAIHEFHSEGAGVIACPKPVRYVTVDPSITGQALAQDLLAYFVAEHLDTPCGSIVFAYHSQSEAGDTYTAGRILVATDDGTDPNAQGVKRTLTLDVGDVLNEQQAIVTYTDALG